LNSKDLVKEFGSA